MSEASDRGRMFEMLVQRVTRRTLKMDIKRDKQSGAGTHKQDIRDRYNQLPIHIECKDQATIKPKEWWRDANLKAVPGQAPIVVFPDNEEVLCVMRYSDLLNFIKEARDWHQKSEELRMPASRVIEGKPITGLDFGFGSDETHLHYQRSCTNGHLADEFGYCQSKRCQYSRGYRKPKVKQGAKK